MIFFKKKKPSPQPAEKAKPKPAKTKSFEEITQERVLTAEGWRRLMEPKKAKS